MNLALYVDDWFSTRTAGELLAGAKRLHLGPRQNRRPTPYTERVLEWPPTPMRTAVRPCGLRDAPSGEAGVHRRAEGRPGVPDPNPAQIHPRASLLR